MVKDTTILRVADVYAFIYISFSTATGTSVEVLVNDIVVSISRLPIYPLDLEAWHVFSHYAENKRFLILKRACRGVELHLTPSRYPAVTITICASRRELIPHRVVETLLDHLALASVVGDESQRKLEPFVFEDANDDLHFHFLSFPSVGRTTNYPILELIPQNSVSNAKVKHVLFLSEGKTQNQDTNPNSWRIGEAFIYSEVVSSTQTMFDKNPSFLRALPSPIVFLATVQFAGRGRGGNTWLSPAGCLQMSLRICVGGLCQLSDISILTPRSTRPHNLPLQPLPTSEWAHRVRLKWPDGIYGLFLSSQSSPTSKSKSTPEPRKSTGYW
ncbi:hypothetical protein BDR04DRAFT_1151537 [Suillus decipiens]|nr:hypothetical protein BDR04DRAFT_1151537 [Suillus decipiens]